MVDNIGIESLVTDIRFQQLKYKQEKTNVFTIVGQTHTEHWHSSFISWLLDAHSSLRLGHFPLTRLLTLYMIKKPDCGFTLRDIYRWNLDDVKFVTEKNASYDSKKRSIDVYGEGRDLILVIENKVNAHENYNNSEYGQTADYYNYVEANKTPEQRALYFFIAADQKQEAYSDMYVKISYQEMYDHIISKCIEHPQISQEGKYLLEQYASNLRETIRNSNTPMAMVNIALCKSLYLDYTEILDGIFEEADQTNNLEESLSPACMVYEHYKNIFDEIFLSLDEYGRTPKKSIYRQSIGLEGLYHSGIISTGMKFHMDFEGETYYAVFTMKENNQYSFQVLDENGNAYVDETGKELGVFNNSQSAGVFAINIRKNQKGLSERVKTINGLAQWVNDEGVSIKELIDKH